MGTATHESCSRNPATRDGGSSPGRIVPRLSTVWRATSSMAWRFFLSLTR